MYLKIYDKLKLIVHRVVIMAKKGVIIVSFAFYIKYIFCVLCDANRKEREERKGEG